MTEIALRWYTLLSTLNSAATGPLDGLAERISVPLVSALLFGLIGATSPCQLTSNAGALAYLSRGAGERGGATVLRSAAAYILGKMLVHHITPSPIAPEGRPRQHHTNRIHRSRATERDGRPRS